MHNELFKSSSGPATDTVNEHGGRAYKKSDMAGLAQLCITGTFHNHYYSSAKDQLASVLKMCESCDPEFLAKLAIYSRQFGKMKDSPSVLAGYLAKHDINLLKKVFSRVINDPKMIRNFTQIIRSGTCGRKSLGTAPKKLIQNYFNSLSDVQLFNADYGDKPSIADVIKLSRPKPATKEREALYAYLIGKEKNPESLLPLAQQYEAYKKGKTKDLPDVSFMKLTSLPLTDDDWKQIAKKMTWTQLRMNLNTLKRHNVFEDQAIVDHVANKLSSPEEVVRSRAFPYQIFTTFQNTQDVPNKIRMALQEAAEVALSNVPVIGDGEEVRLCLDVSGSMGDPATGRNGSATTKTSCLDVAALFTAAVLRKNKLAQVFPFCTKLHLGLDISPLDSIMTNAKKLAIRGGGTKCELPLQHLNGKGDKAKIVIYVSDNQSWAQSQLDGASSPTPMASEWAKYKKRNPEAKLVVIDITPYTTDQVRPSKDVLAVGGFSDDVFDVIAGFIKDENGNEDYWMKKINEVVI